MPRLLPICLISPLAILSSHAGPTEASIMAMMRLSDQPSYSWTATVSDDARTYDIFGKTTRGGFTFVKMPLVNSIRRQLRRSVTDTQIALVFRGNVDCVIETDEGWMRPHELSSLSPGDTGANGDRVLPGATSRTVPIRSSTRRMPRTASDPAADRGYSNLQLGVSHPHEELGVMVGSHAQLTVEGDIVSGTLTPLGAQLLLVRDGQEKIQPLRAGGTFKVWLRDGIVSKYQVKLEGRLRVQVGVGAREIEVRQSTDTILKEIGSTTFEVPVQARQKLGG